MNLAMRDITINKNTIYIKDRQDLLLEKYNILKTLSNENIYLKDIADAYKKYFDNITLQNIQQLEQYNILYKYLESIIMDNASTNDVITNIKKEQKLLNKLIKDVKHDIKKLDF
jgi:hypothetical protein